MYKVLIPYLAASGFAVPKFGSPHLDPAAGVAGSGSAAAGDSPKVVPMRDISVEDVKSKNPDLYKRIGMDYARAERDREDSIKALIKESGCDEQLAATLFVSCKDKNPDNARVEIARVTSIEASLQAAKIAGLDDDDIKALRADVRELSQIAAVRLVQGFVTAKIGANARIVKTADPATTGNDPEKPAGGAKPSPLAEAVKAAQVEYAANFGEGKGIMGLTQKDYVEQSLDDKKIAYTESELKAIAPDLFK